MFGENFPYTNFHDLNMDWIIKIAKDFLDQYTHIQQIIADGEASLQELTTSGLQQLQDKADNLEALLQAWYNEHSQDIANQLAEALSDLNDWYNEHSEDISDQLAEALSNLNDWYTAHQNYLDQTLADKTAAFNSAADTKTAQCIASIPSDYTALSQSVDDLIINSDGKITEVSHRPEQFIGVADEDFLSKTAEPLSTQIAVDISTDIQNNPSGFLHSITINATANGTADICFLKNYAGDSSYMQIYAIISGISIKAGTHTYYNTIDFICVTPIKQNSAICYYSANGADLFTDGNTLGGDAYRKTHGEWGTSGVPSLFSKGGGNHTSYTFSIYFTIQTASNPIETISKQISEFTSLPDKYISYYNERFFDKNTLPTYETERDVYTDLLNNKPGLLHSFTLNASADGTAELCLLTNYSGDDSYLQIYAIISNVTIHKGIYTYVNGVDFTYNGLVKENSVLGYHSATAILYEDYQRTGNGGYARDHSEWGTSGVPSLVVKGPNGSKYSYALYLTIYRPNNNLVGKLGDSLGDSTTANGNWQNSVQKGLALSNMLNHGVGATTVSGTSDDCMNNDNRINALNANADLIIVMAGINDFAQSKAMGAKTYANIDITTFFGACNVMFRKLTNRYPTKRIVAFGTLFAYRPNNPTFIDGVVNTQGLTCLEYSQAMMESAQLNGIEHYDIGGNLGINISNIMTYTEDGIHPNSDYSAKIAEYFISKLTYNK